MSWDRKLLNGGRLEGLMLHKTSETALPPSTGTNSCTVYSLSDVILADKKIHTFARYLYKTDTLCNRCHHKMPHYVGQISLSYHKFHESYLIYLCYSSFSELTLLPLYSFPSEPALLSCYSLSSWPALLTYYSFSSWPALQPNYSFSSWPSWRMNNINK